MILTDNMIRAAVSAGTVKIEPFDAAQIQPASYDLRIGPVAAVSSIHGKVDVEANGFLEMTPGDFAIVVSEETITLDNQHTGRFGLRSKWARKGLIATTGPQIDPGFTGRLNIGLTNLTSKNIALSHLDDFLTVEFHKLSEPAKVPYSGVYQNQSSLSNEDLETVLEREVMSLSEMNTTLRALTASVNGMEKAIASIERSISSMRWFVGAGIGSMGVGIAIIAVITGLK
ncbi:dCTP deaminase [Candidatus Spongiihabitans sp.]|uniref:dCTP deaminase n=1 Tax=Candidatus Spongiihabitans sp. TaxID=3101308 RepID=UPI003C7AB606